MDEGEVQTVPSTETMKRPLGLTIISTIWLPGGFANIVLSLSVVQYGIEWWYRTGYVLRTFVTSIIALVLGFVQIYTIYGLLKGKSWSYRLALIVVSMNIIVAVFSIGFFVASIPMVWGLWFAMSVYLINFNAIWLVIFWSYLHQSNVRKFLGLKQVRQGENGF